MIHTCIIPGVKPILLRLFLLLFQVISPETKVSVDLVRIQLYMHDRETSVCLTMITTALYEARTSQQLRANGALFHTLVVWTILFNAEHQYNYVYNSFCV